jgi:acetyl coenzyme A synthetase (ADP forming)-like protein
MEPRFDSGYPASREADVILRDGSTVHVRPVRREDEAALAAFFEGLTPESRGLRFFSAAANVADEADRAVDVDYADRYGLIATRGQDSRPVGHGAYARISDEVAEVAFAIADVMQGRGLGTILLAHLAEVAHERGITAFEAEVLPENHRMIAVFRDSGLPVEVRSAPGSIQVKLPTSLSSDAVDRFADRDRAAAAAAVARFVEASSVAVIGASRARDSVGGQAFHNLLDAGFQGTAYPVNRDAEVVQSVRAYGSVAEIPGPVDLAVVAVPAAAVLEVVEECAAARIPAVVVMSAGFAEVGEEGAERQRRLLAACRRGGVRLIGPNCLGAINTAAEVRLNATFAPRMPASGNVGFVSQSGALGLAFIELSGERNLGLSSFASVGNRADITANDLLEYWESDARTDVTLLYIESFSDPRRFSRVAPRVGRTKPVVVVKSGRSQAGARATSSHTGAMLAASDLTVDALFEQAGVIRTDSLAEMLDVASLLANQPLPGGRRVAVLTNAGGPGIMCADACEASGLELPPPPKEVQERLRRLLPPEASLANPVDMIATATAEQYRESISTLAAWDGIDALIVIFVRPLLIRAEEVADAVARAIDDLPRRIPVQAVFMSGEDRAAMIGEGSVPTYIFPEDCAKALARAVRHAEWRQRPARVLPSFADTRPDVAAAVIAETLEDGPGWLDFERLSRLLDAYGISLAPWRLAGDSREAGDAAVEVGGRVALKALGPEIVHKTELGAIRIGLSGRQQVADAASGIDEGLRRAGVRRDRFLVQAMVEGGVEMLVGVVGDAVFGPVIACGAGGVEAELINDVSVRLSPLTEADAGEMLRSLATFPLLTGYRGAPKADLESLEQLLLRTSAMVEAHHEIAELDLNPVIVSPNGVQAVDARVRVEAVAPRRSWPRAWSP